MVEIYQPIRAIPPYQPNLLRPSSANRTYIRQIFVKDTPPRNKPQLLTTKASSRDRAKSASSRLYLKSAPSNCQRKRQDQEITSRPLSTRGIDRPKSSNYLEERKKAKESLESKGRLLKHQPILVKV